MDEKQQAQQQAPGSNAAEATEIIPVLQEQVTVGKRLVETGKVRISKTVTEDQTSVSLPLLHEEYDVERVPINKVVETAPPALRYEGDTAIIPVLREVLVVQKQYEITEEIRITKRKTETTDTQQVTLRREEVHIERSPIDPDRAAAQ
jgi:uncharacterized protein (TIGR02271 family)